MTSVDPHTYDVTSVDAIPVDDVRASVGDAGFAILRGIATRDEARDALHRAQRAFRPEDDHASVGESPDEVRRNFQKWSVGTIGGSHREYAYARMLRVI